MYKVAFVPDLAWWISVTVLGLIAGSFLNVVIYRLPLILRQRWQNDAQTLLAEAEYEQVPLNFSLFYPGSHCTHCKTPILWRHKIPIISFILLRGSCAYCHKPISMRYPVIELLTMIIWLLVFSIYSVSYMSIVGVLFASSLIVLACIDQKEGYLVDEITIPLIWAGLLLNCFDIIVEAEQAILGAVLGYASFFLLNQLFKLVRGRHGLGQGDMKLLAAIGAWLGWEVLPALVLIASLSGLIFYGVVRMRQNYALSDAIPFGPYLAFSGILSFLFYSQLKMPFEIIPSI